MYNKMDEVERVSQLLFIEKEICNISLDNMNISFKKRMAQIENFNLF